MVEWRLLFYITTVFTRLDQSQSFLYNSCECGEVSPRNVYVSVGASMELTCTIEEDSKYYHLMFVLGNEEQSSVQKSNNSIVLTKVIQGRQDGGNYICMKNGQKVGSSTVEVQYPLQNVSDSDFVCELLDWDKTLYCRWKIGVYKNESSNIKVSIVAETICSICFMDESMDRNHQVLSPAEQNQTSALWNGLFDGLYSFKFHLTQNQTKTSEVIQQTILRKTADIVKPAPISQILVEKKSSTCLTVRWSNSNPTKYQVYKVFSSDEWNSQNFSNQINKTDINSEQQWEICDLVPYTKYTFTIIRRPLKMSSHESYSQGGLWSDPASETFRTLSDVPASPPKMTLGSFSRVGDTRIVIYWKPIKPMDRHGIIANYTISYASLDGNFTGSYSSPYENISLSMNSDKWYNVSLSAMTTDGDESPSVFILVPPKTVELTIPSSVVEVNTERTKTLVHWEGNTSCLYYVIFWMTNNELDWITSLKNETVIPLANLEKVGVSCSSVVSPGPEGQTMVVGGGLQWSKCKYFEGKEPALPAFITVTPYNSALEVTWILQCDDFFSYPLWLNVTWCDLNPSTEMCQDVFFALVDPSKKFYRIENLNPRIKYRVRINSISNDSVRINMDFNDQQPQVYENIADNSSESMILVAVVVTGISGVVILGIIFIVRKCRSVQAMEVDVPSIGNKDNKSWSHSVEKYPEGHTKEDYKILDTTEIIDGTENERNYYNNVITSREETEDNCSGPSDCVDVPNILKEMQRMDSGKKEKLTPQSSDYSKFIIASGQTNNSDFLNQLHSFPESHVIGSQSPFSWSSNGNNQSTRTSSESNQPKSLSGVTNHNLSSPNRSETLSSGTGSETPNKSATLFSTSSSEVNDDYRGIDHFDTSSTDMSAYFPSHLNEFSGYDISYQGGDFNARMNVNEDSSAATDDELLEDSSDIKHSRGMKENTSLLQQPVSHPERPPPLNMQQVPMHIINCALSSAISPPVHQVSNSAGDRRLVHQADSEQFSLDSGASLTRSTSDSIETGYKTVDLDSACLSSVQSSIYD